MDHIHIIHHYHSNRRFYWSAYREHRKTGRQYFRRYSKQLVEAYGGEAQKLAEQANCSKAGPLQALVDIIVADNIIGASSNNRNMLQVIFLRSFWNGLI